ncbi:MAG: GTP-binding protein, partial [Phycisphaerales bacterium]|nr:GTP-binding protein [Phycisphaerales bacterium]
SCHAWLATPVGTGGVAIVELEGNVEPILDQVAHPPPWPVGDLRLREIAGIDTGLVVRVTNTRVQLTPHGGERVVARIAEALSSAGATWLAHPPAASAPEAGDDIEASALDAIGSARSPAAIPLLLEQVARWRADDSPMDDEGLARTQRLNRLLVPPTIAVIGPPNAGKSTLLNRLLGRQAAIVSPLAGTTRDRVGASVDIGGLVVNWLDTPGRRTTDDPIEQAALELAEQAIESADFRIHLVAPDAMPHDRPVAMDDIEVVNKSDLPGAIDLARERDAIPVSAETGAGIDALLNVIRESLVPAEDMAHPGRWDFPGRRS